MQYFSKICVWGRNSFEWIFLTMVILRGFKLGPWIKTYYLIENFISQKVQPGNFKASWDLAYVCISKVCKRFETHYLLPSPDTPPSPLYCHPTINTPMKQQINVNPCCDLIWNNNLQYQKGIKRRNQHSKWRLAEKRALLLQLTFKKKFVQNFDRSSNTSGIWSNRKLHSWSNAGPCGECRGKVSGRFFIFRFIKALKSYFLPIFPFETR